MFAVATAVPLAFLAGMSRAGENVVDAPLQIVWPLLHLALISLFILWFGIGETPKIGLVTLGAGIPIYLKLFAGVRGVDPKLIEMARVHGLSRLSLIGERVLPSAIPSLLVGLRFAFGIGWRAWWWASRSRPTAGSA